MKQKVCFNSARHVDQLKQKICFIGASHVYCSEQKVCFVSICNVFETKDMFRQCMLCVQNKRYVLSALIVLYD